MARGCSITVMLVVSIPVQKELALLVLRSGALMARWGTQLMMWHRTVPPAWQGGDVEPVPSDAFEVLVADALASIPENLRAGMENVAIIVDDQSPPGPLFGLYEGIPLTKRAGYAGVTPDRITLFLATICRSASTPEELARRVRVTLLHEVGHHFGMEEARLRELGWS